MPVGWPELVAFLTSIGFGVLSAVFPLINAESYVFASQVSAVAGAVPVAVGVGIGQTVGKLTLFLAVRSGRNSRFFHARRQEARRRPRSPSRQRIRRAVQQLLALVGSNRWGLPIVFLAAIAGLPPLYAVALLAGATKMNVVLFTLLVLVGRVARFVLIALGVGWFHG